jgi:hypothetical protein
VRRLLGVSETYDVAHEENDYGKRLLAEKSGGGDIELFGDN